MDAYISPEAQAQLLSPDAWTAAYHEGVALLFDFAEGLHSHGRELPMSGIVKDVQTAQIFVLFTVLQFLVTWVTRWLVFEPMARILMSTRKRKVSYAKVEKFAQSANEAMTYGVYAVFGVLLVLNQSFVWPSERWFPRDQIWGGHPVTIERCVICYYLLYGSRYVAAAASLLFEHKRKDFWEMMAHHLVTVVVIAISYSIEQVYIGCIVMVLLDPADVPLHIAKLWKYCADVRKGTTMGKLLQLGADICFAIFVIVFVVTRNVMYPYACYAPLLHQIPDNAGNVTCTVLLWILCALQYMWFGFIVKAIVKMMQTGGVEDVRSDSEDEAGEGESKKTK